MLHLVSADAEAIFRVAQLARPRRLRMRLARERDAPAHRAVHRDRVREVRVVGHLEAAASGHDGTHEVDGRVEHRVGDVLEDVEPEDAAETADGPVRVEERRGAQLHVHLVVAVFALVRSH